MKNIHRSFQRALALVLAFAMVLTMSSVSQTMDVSAASAKYVKSIKTSKKSVTVNVKKSVKVNATVKVAGKTSQKVTVKTSDKKVATVKAGKPNKKGVSTITITGKKAGKATITVTTSAKGKKGKKLYKKIKVTVKEAEEQPQPTPQPDPQPQPQPTPTQAPAMKDGSVQLPITNGQSSDPSIATVDATGKVTAGTKAGTATITGKDAAGKDVVYTVTVTDADVAASHKVTINVAKTELVVGESIVATATVVPASDSVTWASSDNSIATVDKDGQIVAVAAGSTRITATTASGATNSVTITVKAIAVTGIEVVGDKDLDLIVGGKTTLIAKVLPESATDRRYEFSVDKENIVTINALGEVTAVNEGTVIVTAKTVDGGFAASWVITVNKKVDTNKISVEMTVNNNTVEDQENTVLTGETMKVTLTAKKGTQPYTGTVALGLENISGYDYYGFVNGDFSQEHAVTTRADGTATFNIKLNPQYKDPDGKPYDATIDKFDEYGFFKDAAFASYELTADVDNVNVSTTVVFAQILTVTEYGLLEGTNTSITVNNEKEIDTPEIRRTTGAMDTQITTWTDRYDKTYQEEYVVSQMESFDDEDRHIELDASPLLVIPAKVGDKNKGFYGTEEKPVEYNYTSDPFSVYSSFENAYTIEDVPGGLKALVLKFSKLDLCDYTKLVVRCYVKDTDIPYIGDNGNYLEKILTYDTDLSRGDTVTLDSSIFESLRSEEYVDIKVFVESAGQVDNKHHSGYTLVSGYGQYRNELMVPYDTVKLSDCVEWSVMNPSMSAATVMTSEDAAAVLGNNYNSEYTYKLSLPSGQNTGNAFIYVSANGQEKDPFMYPSIAKNNENILYDNTIIDKNTGKKYYPINQRYVLTDTTNKMVKPLSAEEYSLEYAEDGDLHINAKTAGYIQVKANINVTKDVTYEVHSSIQWCPAPTEKVFTNTPFYAVAGETVTLKAKVKSKNATDVRDVEIEWNYDDPNITVIPDPDGNSYITDAWGEAWIQLKATKAFDLRNIEAELADGFKTNYSLEWYVADNKITTDYASIYWVMPGVYYDNSALVAGDEYYTNQAKQDVRVADNTYLADAEWLLGVKVVGTGVNDTVDPDDENHPIYVEHNIVISNIGLNLENVSTSEPPDKDTVVSKQEQSNGTWLLTNAIKGKSEETISLTGKIDKTAPCIITIDGEPHTSVGTGNIVTGRNLIIPINWNANGQILSIETPSGSTFNIANEKDPIVYFKVVDKSSASNVVADVPVKYTLTNPSGVKIAENVVNTDAKGIFKLVLDDNLKPSKGITTDETWTLAASINNETPIQKDIVFKVADDVNFSVKKVESDGVNQKVTVTFEGGSIDSLDAIYPSMFDLTDENNTKVKVTSIEKDANNANVLILTTDKAFTGDITYTISNEIEDEATGYTIQLLDSKGHLFKPAN